MDGCRTFVDPVLLAIPCQQQGVFGETGHLALGEHGLQRIERGHPGLRVDGAEDFRQRTVQGVSHRPTGQALGTWVHAGDQARDIGGDHGIADGMQRGGEAFFAGSQGVLRLLALGDVAVRDAMAKEMPCGVMEGMADMTNPPDFAIGAEQPKIELASVGQGRFSGAGDGMHLRAVGLPGWPILGVQQPLQQAQVSREGVGSVTRDAFAGGGTVQDGTAGVLPELPVIGVIRHDPEMPLALAQGLGPFLDLLLKGCVVASDLGQVPREHEGHQAQEQAHQNA